MGEAGIDFQVVRLGGGPTKNNTTTIAITVIPVEPADTPDGPALNRSTVVGRRKVKSRH